MIFNEISFTHPSPRKPTDNGFLTVLRLCPGETLHRGPESKEKRRQRRRGGFAGGKRALATSPQRKSAAMIDRDGRWKFLFAGAGVFGMRAESTRGV